MPNTMKVTNFWLLFPPIGIKVFFQAELEECIFYCMAAKCCIQIYSITNQKHDCCSCMSRSRLIQTQKNCRQSSPANQEVACCVSATL